MLDDTVTRLRTELVDAMTAELTRANAAGTPLTRAQERAKATALLDDMLRQRAMDDVMAARELLTQQQEQDVLFAVLSTLAGMSPQLVALLHDPNVENIDANGADSVWVEYADGSYLKAPPIADNDEQLIELIRSLAADGGGTTARAFDTANPLVTVRLPDGSRLNATMAVSPRPCVNIRKHRLGDVTLDDLVAKGTLDEPLRQFLAAAVAARCNLMVAGGTNTGKTTMLRALLTELPVNERLIVVERAAELDLERYPHRHANVAPLEERLPNLEGRGGVPMTALVRQSLGMHPSRVIVGEVLGPEITTMLRAMTQGNHGSISTVHARSNQHVIARLHACAEEAPDHPPAHILDEQIAGGLDFLIYLERRMIDGRPQRLVTSICEVTGDKLPLLSEVFASPPEGAIPALATGVAVQRADRLRAAGYRPRQLAAASYA